MNNTPIVRFAEFAEEWEQRRLRELAVFNPKSELPESFEYVDLESVVGTEMLSHRTETKETAPSRAQRLAQKGDLFFQTVRPYQKNNYLFEKPDNNYVFSTGYAQMRPLIDVDGRFLLGLVQTDGFVKEVLGNCTGTSYPAINANDLADIKVFSPNAPQEQEQIGSFFNYIDSLITLQNHKCEKLIAMKAACHDKMFPKAGRKVPEMRIDGFIGDWEPRKLGDESIEIVAGGDVDKSLLDEHGQYPVIANALTDDGVVGYYSKDYRIKAPAVTVTGRGDVGHAKARTVSFTPVVRLLSIRSKHDVFFLENAINILNVIIESTGVPQLTVPQLSQYVIYFPPTEAEEKAIGAFFAQIDNLISLHQRKLKKLQQFKQAMMHNMFV